jgi:hypothetical protein
MEGVRTVQHERLTIQEAAHRLGVIESALRSRCAEHGGVATVLCVV